MHEELQASRDGRSCPDDTDVGSRCDPGFRLWGPQSSTTPHTLVPLTSLSVHSQSSLWAPLSTYPVNGGVYRILSRLSVSSHPIPEILNVKSANALDLGRPVTFCSGMHTVMCACLWVFLRREAVAFLLGDRLRFCWYLIISYGWGNTEMPKSYLGLIVPPFPEIPDGALRQTTTGGE